MLTLRCLTVVLVVNHSTLLAHSNDQKALFVLQMVRSTSIFHSTPKISASRGSVVESHLSGMLLPGAAAVSAQPSSVDMTTMCMRQDTRTPRWHEPALYERHIASTNSICASLSARLADTVCVDLLDDGEQFAL